MMMLDPLTDPTDEITNGEAKGRRHPGDGCLRCLLFVHSLIDTSAGQKPESIAGSIATISSLSSAACGGGVVQWGSCSPTQWKG